MEEAGFGSPELGYLLTEDPGYKTGTILHLIYEDGQRLALKQLLEDFNAKARKIGVELKAAEFPEI